MANRININPLLDEIIKESGLTQEEIAKELGYDRAYLSQARKEGTKKLQDKLLAYLEQFRKPKEPNHNNNNTVQVLLQKISSLERELGEKGRHLEILGEIKVSLEKNHQYQKEMFDLLVAYQKHWLEIQLADPEVFAEALRKIQRNALANPGGPSKQGISLGNGGKKES